MVIRIKTKDLLDYVILWALILEVMIIRWLNLVGLFNVALLILLTIRCVYDVRRCLKNTSLWLYFLLVIYMIWNYFYLGGEFIILIRNISECIAPSMIMIYIGDLMFNKKEFVFEFFSKLFWPLNLYNILNMIIILLQLDGFYWLAGFTSSENPLYIDHISGLLGFNGMPVLALYSALMFIYNLYYARFVMTNHKKHGIYAYNTIQVIFYSVVSLYNDNKGFYLILFMYIIIYSLSVNESIIENRNISTKLRVVLLRYIPYVILVIFVSVLLYRYTKVGGEIDKIIHEFDNAFKYINRASGGSERISMIIYAINSPDRIIGYGVGRYKWTSINAFGFAHYGQSDIGTFLCLGGIVFFVILSSMIIALFYKVYEGNCILAGVFLFVFYVIGVFTQVFTVTSLMVCAMLFAVTCWGASELVKRGACIVK